LTEGGGIGRLYWCVFGAANRTDKGRGVYPHSNIGAIPPPTRESSKGGQGASSPKSATTWSPKEVEYNWTHAMKVMLVYLLFSQLSFHF